MAHTEVLLIKPVENLGAEGDQVKVRAGYARNFLLPQKLAVALTLANTKRIEALKKRRADREAEEFAGAQKLAAQIEKVSIAFAVKTGEGGKMFGAITAADIHQKLTEAGVEIDKRKIHLYTPAKTLGKHEVQLKLHHEVHITIPFDIVSENPIVQDDSAEGDKPKTEKRKIVRKTGAKKPAAKKEKSADEAPAAE